WPNVQSIKPCAHHSGARLLFLEKNYQICPWHFETKPKKSSLQNKKYSPAKNGFLIVARMPPRSGFTATIISVRRSIPERLSLSSISKANRRGRSANAN